MLLEATCYEADISLDIILSYLWITKDKIGVFPHHKAPVVDEPRLLLLFGQSEKNGPKQRSTKRRIRQVLFFQESAEIDHYLKDKMLLTLPMSELQDF